MVSRFLVSKEKNRDDTVENKKSLPRHQNKLKVLKKKAVFHL